MTTKNDKKTEATTDTEVHPWNVLKVVQDLEAKCPQIAIYVVHAEHTLQLSGGNHRNGAKPIPFKVNLRDIPHYARAIELPAWCRRVLNDSSGGADMTRSKRIEGYTTRWENMVTQTHTRRDAVDDLTRALRDRAVKLGKLTAKQARTHGVDDLKAILPKAVVKHVEDGLKMDEQIKKGIPA